MSIFNRLETLQEDELKDLVAVSVQVLLGSEELPHNLPEDLASISSRAAAREIASSVPHGAGRDPVRAAQQALQDTAMSRELSIRTLQEIGREPALAAATDQAYANRAKQLATPEVVLLTGTLLVLALRISEFRKTKDSVSVRFDKVSAVVSNIVTEVLKRISV